MRADIVEIDIQKTKYRQLALLHDHTPDRTTISNEITISCRMVNASGHLIIPAGLFVK